MLSQEPKVLHRYGHGLIKIVGLISDTHVPVKAKCLPQIVFKHFEKVDYIIHAGDLVDMSVIDDLEQLAPVLAVWGNVDGPEIRKKLPKLNSVKVFNWKVGVVHNPNSLFSIKNMLKLAKENDFNALVYGHTHKSNISWKENILFINPGSPTNPLPPFIIKPSVALLRITQEKIIPEIIRF